MFDFCFVFTKENNSEAFNFDDDSLLLQTHQKLTYARIYTFICTENSLYFVSYVKNFCEFQQSNVNYQIFIAELLTNPKILTISDSLILVEYF